MIENVVYHDGEIEPSKQFKWSVCRWRRHIVYISRLSVQLEAQDDKHFCYFVTFMNNIYIDINRRQK